MRTLPLSALLLVLVACGPRREPNKPVTITLTYEQADIQKEFDTLYGKQLQEPGIYRGLIEQALAHCHRGTAQNEAITQDVFSSMYLDTMTMRYDCVTTTTFRFPKGTIAANGVFNLVPGDTIAPNHDFPITGGSGIYRNIYGTYTRTYSNGVYHVELRYYRREN